MLIVQLILFVIKFFVLIIGDTAMASQPDLQCQDKDLKYLRKGKLQFKRRFMVLRGDPQ